MNDKHEQASASPEEGEDRLHQVYEAARLEPPARLDAAIRGAAARAVSGEQAGEARATNAVPFPARAGRQGMRYGFAMAAGLVMGVFLSQLLLIETQTTPDGVPASDTVFRGAGELEGLDGLPELSKLPREEWLSMIADYLAAGDTETADALMRAYVKQFPPGPEGEAIQP